VLLFLISRDHAIIQIEYSQSHYKEGVEEVDEEEV